MIVRPTFCARLVAVSLLFASPLAVAESSPPASGTAVPLPSSSPQDPRALTLYERALSLFRTKDYAASVAAFDEGYAIEPHRAFLFGKAQAQRLAGDCAHATATYRAFLATEPSPLQVEATELGLARCAQEPVAPPPRVAPAPPAVPVAPVASAPPTPRATATPSWRRPVALALWGASAVSLATSAGFFVAARGARDEASGAAGRDYAAYQDAWERSNQHFRRAELALMAGALFAAAGAAYVAFLPKEAPARVAAAPNANGGWEAHWVSTF